MKSGSLKYHRRSRFTANRKFKLEITFWSNAGKKVIDVKYLLLIPVVATTHTLSTRTPTFPLTHLRTTLHYYATHHPNSTTYPHCPSFIYLPHSYQPYTPTHSQTYSLAVPGGTHLKMGYRYVPTLGLRPSIEAVSIQDSH